MIVELAVFFFFYNQILDKYAAHPRHEKLPLHSPVLFFILAAKLLSLPLPRTFIWDLGINLLLFTP